MRLSAPLLLLLAWSALANGNDADYRLQLPDTTPYRLHQPELLKLSDVEQRAARRQALGGLPFAEQIQHAADAGGIEAELLHALVQVESDYNPRAVSPKGALGLAQMMPATARAYGVSDALRPADNLRASALHLRDLFDHFGKIDLVLSAYNAGSGAVKKYGGVPPYTETRAYVPRVSGRYEALKRLVSEAEPAPRPSPYRLQIDGAELRLAQPRR